MGTYQLGPETPRPFSVISEGHVFRYLATHPHPPHPQPAAVAALPSSSSSSSSSSAAAAAEDQRYTFGPLYEKRLTSLIEKYADIAIDERVCYVGEERGSLAPVLERLLCLVHPVESVVPGYVHYEQTDGGKHLVPVRTPNVGAEEHFDSLPEAPLYDKVIVKDAISYIDSLPRFIAGLTKVLSELGKVLIVHRDASMSTLPIWYEAKCRLERYEQPYSQLLDGLAKCGLSVFWEIECVPVVMPKLKWLTMIRDRFPPIMQIASDYEVKAGLRDVTEGVLKYEGQVVEFTDRLLFIVASKHIGIGRPPMAQRYSTMLTQHVDVSEAAPKLTYSMELTQQLKKLIGDEKKKNGHRQFRGRQSVIVPDTDSKPRRKLL